MTVHCSQCGLVDTVYCAARCTNDCSMWLVQCTLGILQCALCNSQLVAVYTIQLLAVITMQGITLDITSEQYISAAVTVFISKLALCYFKKKLYSKVHTGHSTTQCTQDATTQCTQDALLDTVHTNTALHTAPLHCSTLYRPGLFLFGPAYSGGYAFARPQFE